MDKQFGFEELLLEYCGENVGANCTCDSCEDNREPLRELFVVLQKENEELREFKQQFESILMDIDLKNLGPEEVFGRVMELALIVNGGKNEIRTRRQG